MSDPQPNTPEPQSPSDTRTKLRRSRTHFTIGTLLLLVGIFILASNLGFLYDWWSYWPWPLIFLGVAQFAWPGTLRERIGGYWLLTAGIYGAVSEHQFLGLDYGNSWPIFIIAVGLRVILGGITRNSNE